MPQIRKKRKFPPITPLKEKKGILKVITYAHKEKEIKKKVKKRNKEPDAESVAQLLVDNPSLRVELFDERQNQLVLLV